MVVLKHELRQGKWSLVIWTAAIAVMIAACILIYPEMASDMGDISKLFADMGSFSAAFGMDRINFGEFSGFFGVECGNVLGLGGAFFAALTGVVVLAKEEKEHTAEFLLTHPISRKRIITEKLLSVMLQIIVLNAIVILVTAVSILFIGEEVSIKNMALLLGAYVIMQVEIGAITFGISAYLNRRSIGIGLGLAAVFYFMNIVANLSDKVSFLKYLTPFGYTDSADIIADGTLHTGYIAVGAVVSIIAVILAYRKYMKKDIA